MTASYTVGYKKPPLESRFTKGKSPNPSGGPKQKKPKPSNLELVLDVLTRPRTFKTKDGNKLMPMIVALAEKTAQQWWDGDPRAVGSMTKLIKLVQLLPPPAGFEDGIDYAAEVRRKLEEMAARLAENTPTDESEK